MRRIERWREGVGIILAVLSCLAGAGCGGGGGGGGDAGGALVRPSGGIAVDPYVVGAVFQEIAADGVTVLQDRSTQSDSQGRFSFPKPLTPGSLIRTRADARGTHASIPFERILKRTVDESGEGPLVVSPLTTLLATGWKPEEVVQVLGDAGVTVAAADLKLDPMAGVEGLTSGVSDNRLRLLQASMALSSFLGVVERDEVSAADFRDAGNKGLLRELCRAVQQTLSAQRYEQLAGEVTGPAGRLAVADLIHAAARVQGALVERLRNDLAGNGGSIDVSAIDAAVQEGLAQMPSIAGVFYEGRTGMPTNTDSASGDSVTYDVICSGCHRMGAYDAAGFAPDLSGKGSLLDARIRGGHHGVSPSAAQLSGLAAWLDQRPGGPPPGSTPGAPPASGSGHPHELSWLNPNSQTFHGTAARQNIDSCQSCHGSDLAGGVVGVGCGRCHFGPAGSRVPAGSGWNHGATPHSAQELADAVAVCTACHDQNRVMGNGPASCHDCHTEAAHPTGQAWLDPKSQAFHGAPAAQGAASCKPCHGSDFQGGSSRVSCFTCHFGPTGSPAPAGSAWTHGTTPHGAQVLTDAVAVCGSCHDQSRLFGNGPAPCHDCHTAANHALGQAWLDAKNASYHGAAARQGVDSCKACHGSDLKGGASKVSCSTCHFGPAGSAAPAGSTWTHGTTPHSARELTDAVAVCSACHERSRLYGNGPASCHDCHTAANHALGQAWLDAKNASYHGAAARQGVDSCKACHGSDLRGGSSGVSCSTCHFGPTGSRAPSGSSWTHGTVPHNARALTDAVAVCSACHDQSRLYGNGPSPCHDCHTAATHPVGQPWLDAKNASYHGAAARQGVDSCKGCHGADLRGGSSGVSCYTCHFGPTGSQAPAGSGWTHGTVAHNARALTDAVAVCNACHDQSRLYGNGPSPCHDCHTAATHPVGQPWLDPAAASYHGAAARTDVDSCKACHGSDYQGGSSGVSCYTCHFGPTGTRSPAGTGWAHATGSHAGLGTSEPVCNACHTLERSYQSGPAACHDCHAGAAHAVPYLNHASAANIPQACTACHGSNLQGGTGPACTTCHTAGSPVTLTNCTSCHAAPPGGASAPNRRGAHAAHRALPEIGTACAACHQVAGTGTGLHFNGTADVALSPAFRAETGTFAYNRSAGTCSAVSCHGGQTTPAWLTGTIDVSSACESCHIAGTTQYNGYSSGKHNKHRSEGLLCVDCHDTVRLAPNHFSGLATPAFEQSAAATIDASLGYNGTSCSTPGCHGSKSWR